ncbi:MAG: alpha/beta fold hydrolase [archaeon]
MVEEKVKTIELKANSNREFFLIHGYTGSPTDFNNLPAYLNKKFNANVKIILLRGHGTNVKDLDNLEYEDFFKQIKRELEKDIRKGRRIILGGISFGAMLALTFSSEYPILGVFDVCPPYLFKFPFNVWGIGVLRKYKKYWGKNRCENEKEKRKNAFSYDFMHVNGFFISKQAAQKLREKFENINCPILSIHSYLDPIGHYASIRDINKKVKSFVKQQKIFNTKVHNLFFSEYDDEICGVIGDFIEKNNLFGKKDENKVAAIIPSFNESKRIRSVLKVISKSKSIDEIVVVDDGSRDNTYEIVRKFPKVRYFKNEKNLGKAESMERGVFSTDADIIFFCDADLIGLNLEIIKGIIEPVKRGDFNMFIGLRSNFMQKTIRLIALNSGERAMRRIVWETLPKYFKYKYRVEAGLNCYVKKYFGGFGYKTFDYSQPVKEKKYGFFRGTILRWAMNMDVLFVYVREIFGKHK